MIEKLDRHIKTEENGIRISRPPTHAGCIDKINELVGAVNELQTKVNKLAPKINFAQPEVKENAHEPITITDMFNEMGRLYADLWNKLEDIHFELRNKGGKDE